MNAIDKAETFQFKDLLNRLIDTVFKFINCIELFVCLSSFEVAHFTLSTATLDPAQGAKCLF